MDKHIKEALLFAAKQDIRYYLNSVAVLPIGTAATDGHRLYLNPNFTGEAAIYCRDSIALLDGIEGARVIDATYPDIARVIPRETTPVEFDVKQFAADLRGAKAIHTALRKQYAADRAAGKADKGAYEDARKAARCGSVFWFMGQWCVDIDGKRFNAGYVSDAVRCGFGAFSLGKLTNGAALKSIRRDGAIAVIMGVRK